MYKNIKERNPSIQKDKANERMSKHKPKEKTKANNEQKNNEKILCK
jgi:hypothetical protein